MNIVVLQQHLRAHPGENLEGCQHCEKAFIIGSALWQEKIQGNLRRANTELSVHFRRANTDPSVDFRKDNTEPSVHFRRADAEPY